MYLTQFLHRFAQTRPSATALVCGDASRSYADLLDRVARLGSALRALGVIPGDRIALLSLNSIPCVEVWLAAWWIGAILCPVNTRWSVPEIVASLEDCTPQVLLVDTEHSAIAAELSARVASLRHVIHLGAQADAYDLSVQALIAAQQPAQDGRFGGDHLAALLYTGGTTGRAKGVMLSHRNLWSGAMSRLADNPPLDDSVCLLSTPMFHVAAFVRVLPHLFAGGRCVVLPQFRAGEALDLIEREGVTDLALVPSMLQMVMDHEDFEPQRLRSVQRLAYGAAPSAKALLQRAQGLLPWAGLYQFYGMTESGAVGTMSRPGDHGPQGWVHGRATSAGTTCAGCELRVVDEHGIDAAPGQVGEIVLRGPTVTPGYWQRPEETAQALRDGWLFTGDGGKLDADGYLTVVDRLKDMIVTGGENVYSAEVENALAQHSSVSVCSVIGVPSERWGEAVHAIVVLRAGTTADEDGIRAFCHGLLANYKCPKSVEFMSALPLTAAGKVAKNVLREPHWRGMARRIG